MNKKTLLVLAAVAGMTLVSCGNGKDPVSSITGPVTSSTSTSDSSLSSDTSSVLPTVTVTISGDSTIDTASTTLSVTLTATVTGSSNHSVIWSTTSELVTVANGVVTYAGAEPLTGLNKTVTITATSEADPNIFATKTITLVAKVIAGQVGDLNGAMIEAIGNASITARGTLVDHYIDMTTSRKAEHTYQMVTTMEENAWAGEYWTVSEGGVEGTHQKNTYRRGLVDGVVDSSGNAGHSLDKVYINKNNVAERKADLSVYGTPNLWESNHLWNHLRALDVNKFTVNYDTERYDYSFTTLDDLYLSTYIAYSLTPLLEDTLVDFSLEVEGGKITKIFAATQVLYDGSTEVEAADASTASWSTVELTLEEVGTTEVVDPTPYAATDHTDKLAAAIVTMQNAKSYTFDAVDTNTYQATTDDSAYLSMRSQKPTIQKKQMPTSSAAGPAGVWGRITEDAAVIRRSVYYSGGYMDNPYGLSYSGYKQKDENTYDTFEYKGSAQGYVGDREFQGNFHDVLPQFDFAPEIFGYPVITSDQFGSVYTYTLRDSVINADVAQEFSAFSYASNASQSVQHDVTITVDGKGNLLRTVFPYNISGGVSVGYVTTSYTYVGNTTIPEDEFENYQPRVVPNNWNEITSRYETSYNSGYTTSTFDQTLAHIYGANASAYPTPAQFRNTFGDCFSMYMDLDYSAAGIPVIRYNLCLEGSILNKSGRLEDFEGLVDEFCKDTGYTKMTDSRHYNVSKINNQTICVLDPDENIMIRMDFNGYSTIHTYSYKAGDWSLSV